MKMTEHAHSERCGPGAGVCSILAAAATRLPGQSDDNLKTLS
jgi:hypothetical protein